MEVSRIRALRGPNLWCRQTVIEAIVSCTEVERVIDSVEGFENRLRARFPDIDILRTSSQEPANSMAHALRSEEHTSELQSLMRSSYAVFCLKKKEQLFQMNR